MNGYFYFIVDKISIGLGSGGLFLIFTLTMLATFIINLFLSIFLTGYGIKKRIWYIALSVFFLLILIGFSVYEKASSLTCIIFVAECLLFSFPCFMIKEREYKITNSQRQAVRFLDEKVKEEIPFEPRPFEFERQNKSEYEHDKVLKPEIAEKEEGYKNNYEIDFKHVKNVIEKLNTLGLKDNDKRQVKELESAILSAQSGEFDSAVKSRINDGLGALLKIMSKYGA